MAMALRASAAAAVVSRRAVPRLARQLHRVAANTSQPAALTHRMNWAAMAVLRVQQTRWLSKGGVGGGGGHGGDDNDDDDNTDVDSNLDSIDDEDLDVNTESDEEEDDFVDDEDVDEDEDDVSAPEFDKLLHESGKRAQQEWDDMTTQEQFFAMRQRQAQIGFWKLMHGDHAPIPADLDEAITAEDYKRELRYLLPTPLKNSHSVIDLQKPKFSDLDPNDPALQPHIRPSSPSFFTGRTEFFDQLQVFENMKMQLDIELAQLKSADEIPARPNLKEVTWLKRDDFERKLNAKLRVVHYRELVAALHEVWKHPMVSLILEDLKPFMREKARSMSTLVQRTLDEKGRAYGTGRRKTSVARVWIWPGTGQIKVNKKTPREYFPRMEDRLALFHPFEAVGKAGEFDVMCTVKGGGSTGQVGAIKLGISRALLIFDPEFRPLLKKDKLLTRDSRMVERKKPGQRKARRKFQWVKR